MGRTKPSALSPSSLHTTAADLGLLLSHVLRVLRGERAEEGEARRVGRELGRDERRLVEPQLVERERARLVRAEDVHARELLDRAQPRDDRLLLGERAAPDRHDGRAHDLHRDRDARDEDDDRRRERLEHGQPRLEHLPEDDGAQREAEREQHERVLEHDLLEALVRVAGREREDGAHRLHDALQHVRAAGGRRPRRARARKARRGHGAMSRWPVMDRARKSVSERERQRRLGQGDDRSDRQRSAPAWPA